MKSGLKKKILKKIFQRFPSLRVRNVVIGRGEIYIVLRDLIWLYEEKDKIIKIKNLRDHRV